MKSLQEYLIEAVESEDCYNEGKIWDGIKKWWNGLFEPSQKKYDRYSTTMDGTTRTEYINNIKDNFNISNIKLQKINPSSLKSIIEPNGEVPNKEQNIGFWEFIDESKKDISTATYYAITYITDSVKDVPVLIKFVKPTLSSYDNYLELDKLQVISDYETELSLKKVINFILKEHSLMTNYKGIYLIKDNNSKLYNKLFNDCDFTKETVNNKNIVIYNK